MIVEKILLVFSLISTMCLSRYLYLKRNTSTLYKSFFFVIISVFIMIIGMTLQIFFKDILPFKYITYEYITYLAGCLLPVYMLLFAFDFYGVHISMKKSWFLFIVPIISIIMLYTNDYHGLFFKQYTIDIKNSETGIFFTIHTVYTYILIAISLILLMISTLKKSGFFSIQTLLILLGSFLPLIVNLLGTFKLIPMTVYITPIMFTGTSLLFALSIIKLKALNVIPVAFKTIIDTMSDAFVVLSDDGTIADMNKTFIDKFEPLMKFKEKDNMFEMLKGHKTAKLSDLKAFIKEAMQKEKTITKEYHMEKGEYNRYFEIDIQPIKAKSGNEYIATLLLFRDVTSQKRDIEIMTKNENLVILGELAGGVAHDINTPISAIKSGLLILKDTVKSDDEKMLVERMDSCADKIVNLVNSMRNQIRNIGSDEKTNINIASVIYDTEVIVHNECVKHNVKINSDIKDDINIMGNATKLSQVITNLVMNAIQAYEGNGGMIDIDLHKSDKNEAIIIVQDYAGGIPERIRANIFKNILTTKGVSGTGFGLYLAYSVIKGAFGGEITFDTETGKGTKFYITIPMEG